MYEENKKYSSCNVDVSMIQFEAIQTNCAKYLVTKNEQPATLETDITLTCRIWGDRKILVLSFLVQDGGWLVFQRASTQIYLF